MKASEIIYENKLNNKFRTSYCVNINNNSSSKILPNSKFIQDIPLTTNIFKNHELQKSLSINIYNNNKFHNNLLNNKSSFLTTIPVNSNRDNNISPNMQSFYQNYKNKNKSIYLIRNSNKRNFELKCFNDEKFFSTSKSKKPFLFPKNYFIIKQYRVNHDTNVFNLKHVLTDYTKEYERNSYKIKKVVQNDKFVNKIKNDLLKLKFNNRIKPFDDL
jgi:hypothetical protein